MVDAVEKIKEFQSQGMSPAKIATALNSQGLKTARGKAWAEHSVAYLLGKSKTAAPKNTKARGTQAASVISNGTGAMADVKAVRAKKVAARKLNVAEPSLGETFLEHISAKIMRSETIGFKQKLNLLNELFGQ